MTSCFQLRDEFESAQNIELTDEYSPHDVGGLLKEFLRDLPDPLLCRDLYSAFVATASTYTYECKWTCTHEYICEFGYTYAR